MTWTGGSGHRGPFWAGGGWGGEQGTSTAHPHSRRGRGTGVSTSTAFQSPRGHHFLCGDGHRWNVHKLWDAFKSYPITQPTLQERFDLHFLGRKLKPQDAPSGSEEAGTCTTGCLC